MSQIETRHLFDIHFELGAIHTVGQGPYGQRVIGNLGGGTFEGERLRGRILPSGGDWGLFMPDGTLSVDGRACFECDDGALIYGIYTGRWAIAPEVMAKLADPEQIAGHDPSEYYLRINFIFETAVENAKVAWMNRLIAIATGRRVVGGIDYRVFEIT